MVFGHGAFVQLDARGPAAAVELDRDDVDAPVRVGRSLLFEIRAGGRDEVGAFRGGDGLLREPEGASAAGLDLDEDVSVAVSCDYVYLALAGAVVGRQDGVAEFLEVEARGVLSRAGCAGVSGC